MPLCSEHRGLDGPAAALFPVVLGQIADQDLLVQIRGVEGIDEALVEDVELDGIFAGEDGVAAGQAMLERVLRGSMLAGFGGGSGAELGILTVGGDLGGGGHGCCPFACK